MKMSDTEKHTPTPWVKDDEGSRAQIRGDDMTIVAARHRLSGEVHDANMELIVHAVNCHDDLVAALELAQGLLADMGHTNKPFFPTFQTICAALTKARGEGETA